MSDDAPRLSTEFGQSLFKLGLTTKAQRVEENGRMSAQRDGNNDKWWLYVPWESGLRTSLGHAQRMAIAQFAKLSHLRELISESFGVVTITFPLSLDPTRGTEKLNIFVVRGLVKKLIPNSAYKIGTRGDYIAIKLISLDPLTAEQVLRLDLSAPKGTKVEWSNLPADAFDSCLRKMLAPDLPRHDLDRARLEYVLTRISQVSLFGRAYAAFGKSNISSYQRPQNSLKTKERPRNPKTDAIATAYVPTKLKEVPFDEIDPLAWRQYEVHHETNGTTAAQYAEMLASIPAKPDHPAPPVPDPPTD